MLDVVVSLFWEVFILSDRGYDLCYTYLIVKIVDGVPSKRLKTTYTYEPLNIGGCYKMSAKKGYYKVLELLDVEIC